MGESPFHQGELIKFYTQHNLDNQLLPFLENKTLCGPYFLRLSSKHYHGKNIMRRAELISDSNGVSASITKQDMCIYTYTNTIPIALEIFNTYPELNSKLQLEEENYKYFVDCMIDCKHWVQLVNEHQSNIFQHLIKLSMRHKQWNEQKVRGDNIFIWLIVWNLKLIILFWQWGFLNFSILINYTLYSLPFMLNTIHTWLHQSSCLHFRVLWSNEKVVRPIKKVKNAKHQRK